MNRTDRLATAAAAGLADRLVDVLPLTAADDAAGLAALVADHGEDAVLRAYPAVLRDAGWAASWPRLACILRALAAHDDAAVRRQAAWLLLAAVEKSEAGHSGPDESRGAALVTAPTPMLVPTLVREVVTDVVAQPWWREPTAVSAGPGDESWLAAIIDDVRQICREREEARERAAVAAEIRRVIGASGRTQSELAALLGTSASRLSTYAGGRVVPSAAMMLRIKRLARRLAATSDAVALGAADRPRTAS